MPADQLLASLPPEHAVRLLEDLRGADRKVYRAILAGAAARRRLRPEFLDKKPLADRHAWVIAELSRPVSRPHAAEFLQTWLLTCRKPMLCAFLDALGAPHDGEGVVESLPPEPPEAALRAALATLRESHPDWEVRIYMEMFLEMDIADWPVLRRITEEIFNTPGNPPPP